MSYVGPNTLKHFVQKYFGNPKNITGLGDGTVTGAIKALLTRVTGAESSIKTLNDSLASQNLSIDSCNDRIDGLNNTVSKIVNEDLAKIGSGETVVGKANIAEHAISTYNGNGGPIAVSLDSHQVQFRWISNQIEVFVDKTRIGYLTTH